MVVVLLFSAALTLLFMPLIKQMLEVFGGFKGKTFWARLYLPAWGWGFCPGVLFGSFVLLLMESTDTRLVLINALGFAVMSLAGIVDDMLGNSSVKGLKGHIKKLFSN